MESPEKKKIMDNFSGLIKKTKVTEALLSHFETGKVKVLSDADVQDIESARTNDGKASKLYKTLMTRKDAYKVLVDALKEENQSGVLDLLEPVRATTHESSASESDGSYEDTGDLNEDKKCSPEGSSKGRKVKTWKDFVFGEDVPFKAVEDAIHKCSTVSVFYDDLMSFVRRLELPPEAAKKVQGDIKNREYRDAVYTLLTEWATDRGNKATFGAFINGLREENLNGLADKLEKDFRGKQSSSRATSSKSRERQGGADKLRKRPSAIQTEESKKKRKN